MKKKDIIWNEDGWTVVQDADAENHVLEISCRAENGKVVEVRIRHNDGEEAKGSVTLDGENAIPMDIKDFKKAYLKGKLEIR